MGSQYSGYTSWAYHVSVRHCSMTQDNLNNQTIREIYNCHDCGDDRKLASVLLRCWTTGNG